MASDNWIPTSKQLPERNQKIEWISPSGLQQRGEFAGGGIWFPEGSTMCVYYTPQFWRPIQGQSDGK